MSLFLGAAKNQYIRVGDRVYELYIMFDGACVYTRFFFRVCMKVRTNFSLEKEVLKRFKKLVPNMSEEVETFMSQRIIELSGSDENGRHLRYEELKNQYNKLVREVAKKDTELTAITPHYHEANTLLAGLGLKKDFSNADELIPKLTKEWKGPAEFLHEYISLVELARDKRVVERELTQLRSQSQSTETSVSSKTSETSAPEVACTAIMLVQN